MPDMPSRAEPLTEAPEPVSARDAAYVLFRHARAILLILALAVGTASLLLAMTSDKYAAETRVLVGMGREKLQDSQMDLRQTGNLVFQERAEMVNDEVEILRDPSLMLGLLPALKARLDQMQPAAGAAATGPLAAAKQALKAAKSWLGGLRTRAMDALSGTRATPGATPESALALRFYHALTVFPVKETDVIVVGFTWDDPAFAADALNLYVAEYVARHVGVYAAKQSVGFYQAQLQQAQADLRDVDAAQAAFLRRGGISNFDLEKTQLLTELGALREAASAARLEQDTARMKLAGLERAWTSGAAWIETPDTGELVAGAAALDQSYVQLLDQRARLLSRFQPGAVQVRDLDRLIARLRGQKYETLTAIYRGRLAAVGEKVTRADSDIAVREAALRDLTARNTDYDALQRRRTGAESLVSEYRQKLEEVRVNSDLDAHAYASVRVIHPALPPLLPDAPRRTLVLELAAAFGLLAGLAYALLAEYLNRTFRQPAHISRVLHLPVLASVPDLP